MRYVQPSVTGRVNVHSTQTDRSGRTFPIPPEEVLVCPSGHPGGKNMVPGARDRGSRYRIMTLTRQGGLNRRLRIMSMSANMALMEKRPGTTTKGITISGRTGNGPRILRTDWPLRITGSMSGPEPITPGPVHQTLSDGINIFLGNRSPQSLPDIFRQAQACRQDLQLGVCGYCTSGCF